MNDFIKQQKEVANDYRERIKMEAFHKTETGNALNLTQTREILNDLITQIITNTGEELMRLAEIEKRNPDNYLDPRNVTQHNQAINTIKKHITSLTGVYENTTI